MKKYVFALVSFPIILIFIFPFLLYFLERGAFVSAIISDLYAIFSGCFTGLGILYLLQGSKRYCNTKIVHKIVVIYTFMGLLLLFGMVSGLILCLPIPSGTMLAYMVLNKDSLYMLCAVITIYIWICMQFKKEG